MGSVGVVDGGFFQLPTDVPVVQLITEFDEGITFTAWVQTGDLDRFAEQRVSFAVLDTAFRARMERACASVIHQRTGA